MYGSLLQRPAQNNDFLREAIDTFFSGASGAVHEFPPVNVWTSENGAVVKAELPGVNSDDLNISVLNDTLILKGVHKGETASEDTHCLRRERLRGGFKRTLRLPFKIESNSVAANFDKGVLTIQVPRAESDKPRRIAVKAA